MGPVIRLRRVWGPSPTSKVRGLWMIDPNDAKRYHSYARHLIGLQRIFQLD